MVSSSEKVRSSFSSGKFVGEGRELRTGVSLGIRKVGVGGMGDGVSDGSSVGVSVADGVTVAVGDCEAVAVWLG